MTPEQGATPRTDAVYRGDGKTLTLVVGACAHMTGGQCIACVVKNENELSTFYEKRMAAIAEESENIERELEAAEARAGRLEEILERAIEMDHLEHDPIESRENCDGCKFEAEIRAALADSPNWLRDRLREEREKERERIITAAWAERVDADATGEPSDDDYNRAIRDVVAAIRALPESE